MGKADVLLSPAIDCNMPCNGRKRIQCWGSATAESAVASPRKKPTVGNAGGVVTRSRYRGRTSRAWDDGSASDSNVLSSGDESGFTQGSGTGGGPLGTRFLSEGFDGCNREEICEMGAETEAFEAETSGKAQEEATGDYCGDSTACAREMRPRHLKNFRPDSLVSNVKSLLSTGLLEGLPIKYSFKIHKAEIPGFIKDLGYLCGCSSCNYTKVLSALEFERHSGATSKNQNNHILLNNGKSLKEVVKELAKFHLDSLDNVIESVIGCSPNWKCYKAWKESFQMEDCEVLDGNKKLDAKKCSQPEIHNEGQSVARSMPSMLSFPECTQESRISPDRRSEIQETPAISHNISKTSYHDCSRDSDTSSSLNYVTQMTVHEEKQFLGSPGYSQNFSFEDRNVASRASKGRKCAMKKSKSPDHQHILKASTHQNMQPKNSTQGRAKKSDFDLHRFIFMETGLPDGAELAYCVRGQKALEGYKLGSAIVCNCCHKEVSPSQFEAHAGWATGVNRQHLTAIRSDDECSVCGDGGELILCAQCPKVFHAICLGLAHIPDDKWYCTYCKDELLSGKVSTNAQMSVRVRRFVVTPALEAGCCSICRGSNFSCSDSFNDETVLICDQCEKEYHAGCLRSSGLCDLQVLPKGDWFCCSNCMSIHAFLRNMASSRANVLPEILLSQLKIKLQEKCLMNASGFDVRWQLLSGKIRSSENKFLLSKAFEIFRNGFDPITERSGRDLIPAMVYGRNMGGHELGGMYCAVLTVNSVVVSAGILRVFGNEAAEMPLVATPQERQGKGYFGCLFSCIVALLRSLNVETLVLPAMENVESMWIHKFGFKRMSEERFRKFAEIFPLMMFRGTKMLEKPV